MQHSTGLYNKIKNVSTPEDIEKWIMERKKRYPTKAKVELRKAEEFEKIQRGEIIKEQQDVTQLRKKKQLRSRNRKRALKKFNNRTVTDLAEKQEIYRGVKEFPGTLQLRDLDAEKESESNNAIIESEHEENTNCISDEEDTLVVLPKVVTASPCIPYLVANYGSASEESDGPEEAPIKRIKLNDDTQIDENEKNETDMVESEITSVQRLSTGDQTCNPESIDSVSTNINTKRKNKESTENIRHVKDKYPKNLANNKRSHKLQLLEKLLSRSIQHERNLICQCIKYIVDNNFFD